MVLNQGLELVGSEKWQGNLPARPLNNQSSCCTVNPAQPFDFIVYFYLFILSVEAQVPPDSQEQELDKEVTFDVRQTKPNECPGEETAQSRKYKEVVSIQPTVKMKKALSNPSWKRITLTNAP